MDCGLWTVGCVWTVGCGLCVDCVWTVGGLCVDCGFTMCTLCVDCVWTVCGQCVCGLCVDCVLRPERRAPGGRLLERGGEAHAGEVLEKMLQDDGERTVERGVGACAERRDRGVERDELRLIGV